VPILNIVDKTESGEHKNKILLVGLGEEYEFIR
jgi:hypothetical protein